MVVDGFWGKGGGMGSALHANNKSLCVRNILLCLEK